MLEVGSDSLQSVTCGPGGVEMELGSTPAVDVQLLNQDTARDLGTRPGDSSMFLGFGVPYFNTFFLKGTLMK